VAASILNLKNSALSCTQRFHDGAGRYSHELFGLFDNPGQAEYSPTCAHIIYEGEWFVMTIAEPINSLGSFRAYDSLACVQGADALHTSGAFAGWASFNYHASGNTEPSANWELDLDLQSMSCLGLRFMQQVSTPLLCGDAIRGAVRPFHAQLCEGAIGDAARNLSHAPHAENYPRSQAYAATNTSYVADAAGQTFNVAELADQCETQRTELLRRCTQDADEDFVRSVTDFADQMYFAIPDRYVILPMTYAAPMRMCVFLPGHSVEPL
jgi:hypothetical protein